MTIITFSTSLTLSFYALLGVLLIIYLFSENSPKLPIPQDKRPGLPTQAIQAMNPQKTAHKNAVYSWSKTANHRYPVRSHNYLKSLYVKAGSIQIFFPDTNHYLTLRMGDRIEIPPQVRHGIIIGSQGASCAESNIRTPRLIRAVS